ncbi:MAG: ParB/RepB/Spo0J family partition protein [Candidatus Omnitrophica bacterium]|nr:ParB/RepB/Spo0J family partition protein [Candidatus Omnitrophota bacterium]
MERRVLGKGLSALIPEKEITEKQAGVTTVRASEIAPNPLQPREHFDEEQLRSLADSIKSQGVIQPLVVRRKGDQYELIAGERRLRAVRLLGLEEVPVLIKEDLTDSDVLQMSLIENLQRENLNPIERARAYRELSEVYGLSQEDIAQAIGRDRTGIINTVKLLKLPDIIQNAIRSGIISEGHARTIFAFNDESSQLRFFNEMIKKKLSVRQVEARARQHKLATGRRIHQTKDPHIAFIEEELQRILGTKVTVVHAKKRGKIVIEYYSDDDLTRLSEKLGLSPDRL